MYNWKVTENSGGILSLFIWCAGDLVYAHTGYDAEDYPKQLREDLAALEAPDCDVDGWNDNDLSDEDIVKFCRERRGAPIWGPDGLIRLTENEYYDDRPSTKVIFDSRQGTPQYQDMGSAGRSVFGTGD